MRAREYNDLIAGLGNDVFNEIYPYFSRLTSIADGLDDGRVAKELRDIQTRMQRDFWKEIQGAQFPDWYDEKEI